MITENLSTLKIYKLTQEQYDKRVEEGSIDENALYLTPDEAIDLSGYAAIEYTDAGDISTLESSKLYADNIASQKSQVQIITWEDDD